MSFHRATARQLPASAAELEIRLIEEMRQPNPVADAQPIIIAEPPKPQPIRRLFVIWDDWSELSQQDRSEIIMNAYSNWMGAEEAARISVAMGLTSAEASRMGIGDIQSG